MSVLNDAPGLARLEPRWTATVDGYPAGLAWSPDGKHLAVAGAEGPVSIYNTSGALRHVLPGHDIGTLDVAWSHDSRHLVTAGQDGCARIWDHTGRCTAVLAAESQWVERVCCSPRDDLIATVHGRQLRFWRMDGSPVMACEPEAYTILDCHWTADGSSVVTGTYGGARLWHPEHVCPVADYPWTGALLAVALSPDGKRLAAGLQEAGVQYWRLDEPDQLYMRGYGTKVQLLSWDSSGQYLATGGGPSVVIWSCGGDGPAGTEPAVLDLHVKPISALAFSPRGRALASGSRDGSFAVVDPTADTAAGVYLAESAVTDLAWHPDASGVAVGFARGRLAVFPGLSQA